MNNSEWLNNKNDQAGYKPPTEDSIDSFIQKVGQLMDDSGVSEVEARLKVYTEVYLWGNCDK